MNQDFVDLLRAFIDHDVRFLIVGAYALALHGRPRATGGLDVWVDATPENARRVVRALVSFGAPMDQVSEADSSARDPESWFPVQDLRSTRPGLAPVCRPPSTTSVPLTAT